MRSSTRLRQQLRSGEVVVAPGVYDGMSARLVARAGFPAAYATGGGIARSMGYPDLGLLSVSEIVDRVANIVEHAGVPVIADADTGYGNELNMIRTVREYERRGERPQEPGLPDHRPHRLAGRDRLRRSHSACKRSPRGRR